MTLHDLICAQIANDGPMRLDSYMALCLMHPDHGYYATRDPFGAAGDFTTAPEISQMFGEVLGLALAQTWIDQGKPADTVLVELGPGRGTLTRDVLRVMRQVGLKPHVHLVETSATLCAIQRDTIGDVTHHDDISTLPQAPMLLLANEFFDALPIRQFIRADQGSWRERQITLDGDALTWALTEAAPFPPLDHRLADTKPGNLVEHCPAAAPIMGHIAQIIEAHGGAAIIIDYGDWRSLGDTFQALQNHAPVDPLTNPGQADLTTHVDFETLTRASTNIAVSAMTPQGVVLERLGITARAQALAQNLTGPALDAHIAAHKRLTHPDEMGHLFKAVALTSANKPTVPGFEF